ncbi:MULTISPECIES: DUF6993 domain-containing protein [Microbacterium]|uniref:DUF6993 domain-containing protein n=1 Tax=Microbacterium schleiferi TaxID=69362 RepID=A0ABU7V8Y0_9MICO
MCADRLTTRFVPARALRSGVVVGLLGAALAAGVLAGCTAAPTPSPTPTVSVTPTPTETAPAAPQQVSEATTADEALPFFTDVVAAVWATDQRFQGRAYIDGLTQVGFDKSAMEVTYDESTVGNPAESIQFSVRWGEECLVGQVGPSTGDPVVAVMPGLQTGLCLIGDTRPIDW